jgi:hypothetical protein
MIGSEYGFANRAVRPAKPPACAEGFVHFAKKGLIG